ncbi:MAG: hypothetical protein EOO88_42720, partial [Pedobacter sp.]
MVTITSPGVLSAKGAIVNNGSLAGTGAIILDGSTAQNISGIGTYGNVTLNNISGTTATSSITIKGTLTLTSGAFTSNGNLTMNLTTGNIANGGAGTIVGNVVYSKTIPSKGYHYISVPSTTAKNASDWN